MAKDSVFLETEKKKYQQKYPGFREEIKSIFINTPIYTNFSFTVPYANSRVLSKMFSDLVYSSHAAKQYTKSEFVVEKESDHYRTYVPDLIEGTIKVVQRNKNHHIYLVEGYYDAFITLRGKMWVDIRYTYVDHAAVFEVNCYVVVTNSILWKLAQYFKKYSYFKRKIDILLRKNVNSTVRLGIKTLYVIQSSMDKKKF